MVCIEPPAQRVGLSRWRCACTPAHVSLGRCPTSAACGPLANSLPVNENAYSTKLENGIGRLLGTCGLNMPRTKRGYVSHALPTSPVRPGSGLRVLLPATPGKGSIRQKDSECHQYEALAFLTPIAACAFRNHARNRQLVGGGDLRRAMCAPL